MNCKTCKHWRHIRDADYTDYEPHWNGPHGECGVIDDFSTENKAWIHGYDRADISLITMPDFGCVLHTQRTVCANCGDDREGKGSLITQDYIFCNEICYCGWLTLNDTRKNTP